MAEWVLWKVRPGVSQSWVQLLILVATSCVTSSRYAKLSESFSPYVKMGITTPSSWNLLDRWILLVNETCLTILRNSSKKKITKKFPNPTTLRVILKMKWNVKEPAQWALHKMRTQELSAWSTNSSAMWGGQARWSQSSCSPPASSQAAASKGDVPARGEPL